jgi:hypothetical protein
MASADWKTTDAKKNKVEDLKTDHVVIMEKEKESVNLGIFTVENYASKPKAPVSVVHLSNEKTLFEKIQTESNV